MAGIVLAGWFISAAALLVGVVLFFSRISSGSAARAWRPLFAATFLAVLVTQIAEQFALCPDNGSPILTALFSTIQTFILERDAPSMTDEIQELLGTLARPIIPSGDDLLTYEHLFMPDAERRATNLYRAYWGYYDAPQQDRQAIAERADSQFEASELHRLSSMASLIFCKHMLFSFCRRVWAQEISASIDRTQLPEASMWMLPADDKALDPIWNAFGQYVSPSAPSWLKRLEHERWVAYTRTLSYERADGAALVSLAEEGTTQNQLARLHMCLVDYDKLRALQDVEDKVLGEHRIDSLTEVSDVVIRHLPEIIRAS